MHIDMNAIIFDYQCWPNKIKQGRIGERKGINK